jgi:hypothetical protein
MLRLQHDLQDDLFPSIFSLNCHHNLNISVGLKYGSVKITLTVTLLIIPRPILESTAFQPCVTVSEVSTDKGNLLIFILFEQ